MPRVLITASSTEAERPKVLLEERVTPADFHNDHFCQQFIERLGWAVVDAHETEAARGSVAEFAAVR